MADLVFEYLHHPYQAVFAAGAEAPALQLADGDRACAHCQRLEHVRAALHAAVDHDLSPPANRRHDLRQGFHAAEPVVQLPPAVVRYPNDVDPAFGRQGRVLGRPHALEHERQAPVVTLPG